MADPRITLSYEEALLLRGVIADHFNGCELSVAYNIDERRLAQGLVERLQDCIDLHEMLQAEADLFYDTYDDDEEDE